jgi:NAD(P)H dehydrogenase (quinone)
VTQSRFLITGATGFTGGNTTRVLLKKGVPVRALVHKEDARSEALRRSGAEVVVGDLLDLEQVRHALEGVEAAYFIYPIRPGLLDATAYFAQAAKEAGLRAVVNMSQISARREAKSHGARDHWISERIFDWSGVGVTHLRPTYFAQWLLYPHVRNAIQEEGAIKLPFGRGRHAPIAAEDQARLIAAILMDPHAHLGATYPLHGPIEMDYTAIAATVSEVLGRTITYQPIDMDEYRKRLEVSGLWPFIVQHLCAVAVDYQNGIFAGTDEVIARVTGQRPMTVGEFVTRHRDAYRQSQREQEKQS